MRTFSRTLHGLLLFALVAITVWPFANAQHIAQAAPPLQRQVFKVAYVYKDDLPTAKAYKLFLDQRGMETSLVTVGEADGFDFSPMRTIIIADDTVTQTFVAGPVWAGSSKALSNIVNSGKYVVGLGYGGTLYFRAIQLEIGNGSPLSGHSTEALNPGNPIWQNPNAIALPPNLTPRLYNRSGPLFAPMNNTANALISRIGEQPNDTDPDGKHYPLIAQQTRVGQCHLLWGWRLGLRHMTVDGQNLFENAVLANPCAQRVAYVYQENFTLATAFRDMLAGFGLGTDLISVSSAATADFSPYLAIIIGSESGNGDSWGNAAAVANVNNSGKPILGMGEGGYAYFGKLGLAIGYANGAHGPEDKSIPLDDSQSVWSYPFAIAATTGVTLNVFLGPANTVSIFDSPATVTRIGRTVNAQNDKYVNLAAQKNTQSNQCYAFWGFDHAPGLFRPFSRQLLVNMLLGKPCVGASAATADLRISKTGAPNPVYKDGALSYQLKVGNAGPNAATNVKVVDALPAGATFASATPSQGMCSHFAGTVSCSLGNMAAGGAIATVAIVITPTATGLITNTAKVTSSANDPDLSNNVATVTTTVKQAFVFPEVFAVAYKQFNPALVVEAFPQSDLSIFGIEITQGIQCFDTSKGLGSCADNSLAVVTKKDTAARIYLRYTHPIFIGGSLGNVKVRLHIFANGVEYVANTTGKARNFIDQNNADSADVYFNVNFSNDIPVTFYAVVDPDGNVSESNEGNNRFPATGTISMNFRKRDTLKILGQRLRYHPSGYSGSQYAGGWAVNGGAADWFEQMLPMKNNGIDYTLASGYLNWTTSLGSGDGQHALIQNLNTNYILHNAFSWLFGTNAFTGKDHVYGWAPNDGYSGGHADMPVYPHAGGLGVVGIGTDRVPAGPSTDNPGGGALIFGHELVHDYDILHTDTNDSCGSSDDDSNFPYSSSSIQEFGYNPITGKIYNPNATHDLMSYCPAGGSKEGWVSPFTWQRMFTKLAPSSLALNANAPEAQLAEGSTLADGSTLAVNVTITNPKVMSNTGKLDNLYQLDSPAPATPLPAGDYAVNLLNSDGKLLATKSFSVSFESEYHSSHAGEPHSPGEDPGDPTERNYASSSFLMDWTAGTTTVTLTYKGSVIDSRGVSAGAPIVHITSPSASVSWTSGTTQTLTWEASDPDGDALSYSVFYSVDGIDWDLLQSDLTTATLALNVDSLAGGANARLRVLATDGVNVGQDETDAPITVPDKAPVAQITNPGNNVLVSPLSLLVGQGFGSDLEDGMLPDGSLAWSSDRGGDLGTGPSLPLSSLDPGRHVITLTVTDSAGQSSSTSVTVFVGQRTFLPVVVKGT